MVEGGLVWIFRGAIGGGDRGVGSDIKISPKFKVQNAK